MPPAGPQCKACHGRIVDCLRSTLVNVCKCGHRKIGRWSNDSSSWVVECGVCPRRPRLIANGWGTHQNGKRHQDAVAALKLATLKQVRDLPDAELREQESYHHGQYKTAAATGTSFSVTHLDAWVPTRRTGTDIGLTLAVPDVSRTEAASPRQCPEPCRELSGGYASAFQQGTRSGQMAASESAESAQLPSTEQHLKTSKQPLPLFPLESGSTAKHQVRALSKSHTHSKESCDGISSHV